MLTGASLGCIELGVLPGPGVPWPGNGDGDDERPDDGDDSATLTLALGVSNQTPQVNEEVFFECEVIAGDVEGVTFAFQPATGRLVVDRSRGTASLIIQESDVGVSLSVTCTARNLQGETGVSPPIIVTATQ
jgi:hypothetical protein